MNIYISYIYIYIYLIYIYMYIYAIMKPMCPASYHHNGFVATHSLGHMMNMMYSLKIYFQNVLCSTRPDVF